MSQMQPRRTTGGPEVWARIETDERSTEAEAEERAVANPEEGGAAAGRRIKMRRKERRVRGAAVVRRIRRKRHRGAGVGRRIRRKRNRGAGVGRRIRRKRNRGALVAKKIKRTRDRR